MTSVWRLRAGGPRGRWFFLSVLPLWWTSNRLLAKLGGLVAAHDWHGVVALERETLALATALRGVDPSEAEFIHSTLGYGYQFLGQYREAKAVSEELRDRAGVANACCNIGSCFKEVGGFGQATAFHLQHRAISEELGDRVGVVNAGGDLAICYVHTGKYGQAIVLHEECKSMAEEQQDCAWVAKACGNLGSCGASARGGTRGRVRLA